MAKKKQRKKHRPQRSAPAQAVAPSPVAEAQPARIVSVQPLGYVMSDIKKIGQLSLIFLAAQLLLWGLFQTTALGERVYSLFTL